MTTQTEALKLALEAFETLTQYNMVRANIFRRFEPTCTGDYVDLREFREKAKPAITAIKEILAQQSNEQGCEHCNHSLYCGTKCKNCGKQSNEQVDFVGCVMVGYNKARDGWFVYEETAPQEFCAIKGPFITKVEAEEAMRNPAAPLISSNEQVEPARSEAYDMIDRFLRNNLGDDDYAEYSAALDSLCAPRRTWVGLTDEESVELMRQVPNLTIGGLLAVEAKLKEKNT